MGALVVALVQHQAMGLVVQYSMNGMLENGRKKWMKFKYLDCLTEIACRDWCSMDFYFVRICHGHALYWFRRNHEP